MKLSISDFIVTNHSNDKWYCMPTQILKSTSFYEQMIDRYNTMRNTDVIVINWCFLVDKSTVFKELGWEPSSLRPSTSADTSGYFPEVATKDKCTMLLITAILLHNEEYEKTMCK